MELALFFACLHTSVAMVGAYTPVLHDMSLKERIIFALVFVAIAGVSLLVGVGYPLFYGLLSSLFFGGALESVGLIKVDR